MFVGQYRAIIVSRPYANNELEKIIFLLNLSSQRNSCLENAEQHIENLL